MKREPSVSPGMPQMGTPLSSFQQAQAIPAYLQADEFAAPRWIAWWYRLFTPRPPLGRIVTSSEREKIRRARLASIILGVQLFFIELPAVLVVQHASNGPLVLPGMFACIGALLCAFYFNKRGMLTIAGILMVASIEVSVMVKIVTVPGGISLFYMPQFDILIQPILIATALLAPWSAFGVAALNIAFVVFALTMGSHAPDLMQALHNPAQIGDLFAVPVLAQVLTSFFAFLIVNNLLDALKRIDQAEQIAALEHQLVESQKQAVARNQQLEQGFAAIAAATQHITNGEYKARIDLPTDNLLYPIARQINQLLNRYETSRIAEAKLGGTTQAIDELANELHLAAQQRRPPDLRRRHTPLDAVIIAMMGAKSGTQKGEPGQSRNQLFN